MDDNGATQFFEALHSDGRDAQAGLGPGSPRYLIVVQGGIPGAMVPIGPGALAIGRSDDNGLVLTEPSVSRRHADLRVDDLGRVWLTDHSSTNGSFRNGFRIPPESPTFLADGDRVRFGTKVVFKYACPDREEEAFQKSMFERTVRDAMTGLFNRAYFLDQLGPLAARASSRGLGLAMVMCDIDRFKSINDTHGHQGGDAVLCQVAGFLRRTTRSDDLVARFGGEEFAIALPIESEARAVQRAERIRTALANRRLRFEDGLLRVTASFGVAFAERFRPQEVDAMIAEADRALYRAKAAGRNRVARAYEVRGDTPLTMALAD